MGRIVDTKTGEIVAEHPSFFERARLICEVLPYRTLGLSRHQINAIEGFSNTIGHTLVEGFSFHFPSEREPVQYIQHSDRNNMDATPQRCKGYRYN